MSATASAVQTTYPPLVCPSCRSQLTPAGANFVCACGAEYPVTDDIPVLASGLDEQARLQATWFDDELDPAWELSRPHGAPRLYGWLMREKFRRAVTGVSLRGRTALAVCAGSGMDTEFLAAAGADPIALDVSLGATRRACERARRGGFALLPLVGDAERLPLGDRTVDIAYVHDGLHHLADPLVGVAELARVARHAVCISEPARAGATALAVRLGIALDREDAGNRVARLVPGEVEQVLRAHGFRIVHSGRYGMYYRHEPGAFVRLLSRRGLFGMATAAFRVANALGGRFGNKLTVVGVRE